jgi:hypothetical protein
MLRVTDTRDVVSRYVTPERAALSSAARGPREGYVRDDEAGD